MKAVVITAPGGPEVLQLQEVEDPAIGDDEFLIKVVAAALNRADVLQRNGHFPPPKGASLYPGLECSGIVQQVGSNVSRWKIGDQVCALPIPPGISLKDAACFPEIHGDGGSSGIGTFAIQIAKYYSAKVFVTAGSEEKLAFCKDLGADRLGCATEVAAIVSEVEKNVWPAIMTCNVRPVIHTEFPLSEAAEAHQQLMESSKNIGKILLLP